MSAVGTMLHGQPSAIRHWWLCSTCPPWLCRSRGTSGTVGLAVDAAWLPHSFPAVAVLSGAVPSKSCIFQKHRGLPALPVDTPEFSSTWQLRLRPCCSTAGSEILGKVQNSSSRASQNHELGETRLIVGISDCNGT